MRMRRYCIMMNPWQAEQEGVDENSEGYVGKHVSSEETNLNWNLGTWSSQPNGLPTKDNDHSAKSRQFAPSIKHHRWCDDANVVCRPGSSLPRRYPRSIGVQKHQLSAIRITARGCLYCFSVNVPLKNAIASRSGFLPRSSRITKPLCSVT